MRTALYTAILSDELDGFQDTPEIPDDYTLDLAVDHARDYTGDAMVTDARVVGEGVLFYMLRGFVGRRCYAQISDRFPYRFFWTVAGNGTPVYEVTSDMEDQRVKDLFGLLFDKLYG